MLSEKELELLKEKLLTTRAKLVDEAEHMEKDAHLSHESGGLTFNHLADAGSDTFELDFSMEQLEHTENLVYEIDEALRRLEVGSYGKCESCEKNIPKTRLQALPFTQYCIKCQESVEAEESK